MDGQHISFFPLLVVISLAFLVPILLSRIKGLFIPIVIGELLAGVAFGRSGLGWIQSDVFLETLSTLGFIFLMFLSGLEVDLSRLFKGPPRSTSDSGIFRKTADHPAFLAAGSYTTTLVLSILAALALEKLGFIHNIWIMALILSTTSLGVVMPVLKENRLISDRYGQMILNAAMVADFTSIFLLSLWVMARSKGLTSEMLLLLVLLVAFTFVYRAADISQRKLPANRFFEEISSATSQIRVRGTLAMALFFIVLANQLGTENIVGAFLAGVIISMLAEDESSELRLNLDAIGYGFFIPVFFIMVGADLYLPSLLQSSSTLMIVPILVVIAFAVKLLSAMIFRLQHPWKSTLAAGFLLGSHLSLEIAAADIGQKLGLIDEALFSAIILVAILTCILSPLLFDFLAPAPTVERNRVLIVGCEQFSNILAERLAENDVDPVSVCTRISGAGDILHHRDQRALKDRLEEVPMAGIQAAVVMDQTDAVNLKICRMLKTITDIEHVIAWVYDPINIGGYRKMGIQTVSPAYATLRLIEAMALQPQAFSDTPEIDEGRMVREVKLDGGRWVGKKMSDITLPEGLTLLQLKRGGQTLLPDKDTVFRQNDVILMMGTASGYDRLQKAPGKLVDKK